MKTLYISDLDGTLIGADATPSKFTLDTINRLSHEGMLISLAIYAVLSAAIFVFAEPLLTLMATDSTIIAESAVYIRI